MYNSVIYFDWLIQTIDNIKQNVSNIELAHEIYIVIKNKYLTMIYIYVKNY